MPIIRYSNPDFFIALLPLRGSLPIKLFFGIDELGNQTVPLSYMKTEINKIKYFLYTRKSSESEDRQVQSLDDQVNRLERLARDLNIEIIKPYYAEAKSAKKPNNRPMFDEMLQRIEDGEAGGILCWQINRLSRNPIDSGKLSWLLQRGVLKSIQTIDRQYLPDDNVLLFSVESGVANQFILDLKKNTKRGVDSKLEKGWLPNFAPLGYLNDKENKTIIKDPERFNLLRKMWDLMLTGSYTPPKIWQIANNEWGMTTKKCKRIGGKPLSLSGVYRIFNNIFYAGIIDWGGQKREGKHDKMITLEEFDRVQMLLGKKGKPRMRTHEFAFTGFVRCGECGCLFTAEEKSKLIKKTGKIKHYTFYHCTRKKKDFDCPQRQCVPVEILEEQIEQEIEKYTILPEFRDWALEALNSKNDTEIEDRSKIYERQHKALEDTQKELDNLTKMRFRDLIDDDMFIKQSNELKTRISQLKANVQETEGRAERWLELSINTFNFATYARQKFLTTDNLQIKKEILMALGSNQIIKDGKLSLVAEDWFQKIKNNYPALEAEYLRLEPTKIRTVEQKTEAFASVRGRWLRGWGSNPRQMR